VTPIRALVWSAACWFGLVVAWIVASARALVEMRRLRRMQREQLKGIDAALPPRWDVVPRERARLLRESGTRPGR